jgi:hypothetical protein
MSGWFDTALVTKKMVDIHAPWRRLRQLAKRHVLLVHVSTCAGSPLCNRGRRRWAHNPNRVVPLAGCFAHACALLFAVDGAAVAIVAAASATVAVATAVVALEGQER